MVVYSVGLLVVIVCSIGLVISDYKSVLTPLYGRAATQLYLASVLTASTLLVGLLTRWAPAVRAVEDGLWIGAYLLVMPRLAHHTAIYTSRWGDPVWGPIILHLTVLLPMIHALVVSAAFHLFPSAPTPVEKLLFALLALSSPHLPNLLPTRFDTIHLALLFLVLGAVKTALTKRRRGWTALARTATLILAALASYPFISSLRPPSLRDSIAPFTHPTHPLRILYSRPSVTGLVVVGELLPPPQKGEALHSLRYLRVAHSLLGGVWIGDEITSLDGLPLAYDRSGTALGDSIYSAFTLQGAAPLFLPAGRRDRALVVGLGAGIAASALIQRGFSTTAVEIDPAIYDVAREYFGLPEGHRVFLEDARAWVRKRRLLVEGAADAAASLPFDVVVHDCFTGGGVPEHVFTAEFWGDLKAILSPHGVVAVSFAGKLGTTSMRAILFTLESVFSHCRLFHDDPRQLTYEQLAAQIYNFVFFCTPSPDALHLRPAEEADYLNSRLRRHIFSTLPSREVSREDVAAGRDASRLILTDRRNLLGRWQRAEALEHWTLMRRVLPDVVWETF